MIAQDYNELVTGNTIYNKYKERWQYLYRSFVGGQAYRDAGYLTRYQLESDAEYLARCRETPLDNQCRSVISVYISFLFRESPDREFGLLEYLPELQDFIKDADFEGRSIDSFMKEVATWSSVFGHAWIIMSKPNIGAVTRADEIAQGVRPYVSLLTPLVVLDWNWTRTISGRYELDYFRYVEEINGNIQVLKEWTPELIKTTIVDTDAEGINEEYQEPNQLGVIPAICCYSDRSMVRGIGVSQIDDIADLQRYIYNGLSEAAQSIRLDSHPSLVVTPDTQVGTGAGGIIQIPENLPGELKPYVLDFAGASIDSIYTVINNTITTIEKAANIGGIRATESRTVSGVALETEFQLLNAKLSSMADNIELAEEQMWRLFCQYQQVPYEVEIEYPGSFNVRDTEKEIDQLVKAKSAATDPRVLQIIDHELIEALGEDADMIRREVNPADVPPRPPFEVHVMVNPETGEEVYARSEEEHIRYSNLGYVHKED